MLVTELKTLSAGLLALAGVAILILTATPGTARVGDAETAVVIGSEVVSPPPAAQPGDPVAPSTLAVPGPPVNPVPIRPTPWPVEMPAVQPGSVWPTFGPLRMQSVGVTPQEILSEPGSSASITQKDGGQEILPVFKIV